MATQWHYSNIIVLINGVDKVAAQIQVSWDQELRAYRLDLLIPIVLDSGEQAFTLPGISPAQEDEHVITLICQEGHITSRCAVVGVLEEYTPLCFDGRGLMSSYISFILTGIGEWQTFDRTEDPQTFTLELDPDSLQDIKEPEDEGEE